MFHFKQRYHYVPPCPKCGSKKTGRYIYLSNTTQNINKILSEYMRKGELVRILPNVGSPKYENAYCSECECEWKADIITIGLTKEQISTEKYNRGITRKNVEYIENIKKITKQKLKEERKLRKQKNKKNF